MLCSFFTIPVLLVENGQNFNHAKWIVFEGIKNATGFPLVTAIQGGNDTYFIGDEWTLSVEILFYFLMATLIFTCGKLDYIQLGYIAAFAQLGIEFFGNHISASYASYFLFGILLFCVRSPKDFLVMGIPIFVGGYDVYERVLNKIQNHIVDTHADQANLISLLFVLCIMFVIIFRDTISSKNDKWVNLIQTLSLMTFPIYLLHETLGRALAGILFSIGGPVILDYGLSFVVVLLMSYFSVKMFEPQVRTLYLKAIKKYF
jgi:peptidoglycan/LPS O-acetylase OafA/YrhL